MLLIFFIFIILIIILLLFFNETKQKLFPIISYNIKCINNNNIPNIIYQTQEFDKVPLGMYNAINKIKKLNPDYSYFYFSDLQAREFIKDNMPIKFLKIWDLLIPGAYKADLFRYCILYVKGGVYLDTSFLSISSLSNLIKENDNFISAADYPIINMGYDSIYNAIIACTPKHPIIKNVLDFLVKKCENRDYTNNELGITGPIALANAFKKYMGNIKIEEKDYTNGIRLISHTSDEYISNKNKNYFYTKYPGYRNEMIKYNSNPHYSKLWKEHKVYAS